MINDRNGWPMAFVTYGMVVVSRSYVWERDYDRIVSIAEAPLIEAKTLGYPIVMYIDDTNQFLKFDPNKVLETGETNRRGPVKFYNISVNMGSYLEDSKVAKLEEFGFFDGSG